MDVLFADALTSMSKLLADMQVVLCAILLVFFGQSTSTACGNSLLGALLASTPYCIRAVQCWLTYSTKNDQNQLINFGKYISSLPVIWLSALKGNLDAEGGQPDAHDVHLERLWFYSVIINTLYSFLWDVFMDWGLGWPRSAHGKPQWLFLRPTLAYKQPLYYYLMIVVDFALRGCWSLKLSPHLQV